MPAQRTDEQIAEEIATKQFNALVELGWINALPEPHILRRIIDQWTAALTRAREAGAEAMRERAAQYIETRDWWLSNDHRLTAAVKIRALPLTEVIPDAE